jgi:hypothetical protein
MVHIILTLIAIVVICAACVHYDMKNGSRW